MSILENMSELLKKGKAKDLRVLVQEALDSGMSAQKILDEGLLKGMAELGVLFKNNQVYVPEVLIAARALNAATGVIKEKLVEEGVEPIGKVVIGTVKGDLHDIGKNLVKMMLEGAGFAVIDLGVDLHLSLIHILFTISKNAFSFSYKSPPGNILSPNF